MNQLLEYEFKLLLDSLNMTKNHYTATIEYLEGINNGRKKEYKHFSEDDFARIKKEEQKFKHINENIIQAIEQTEFLQKRINKIYP